MRFDTSLPVHGGTPRWVRAVIGCLLGLLAGGGALAAPATYEIDPEHLSIGFLVDHVGFASVLGMFRQARGTYVFDEETETLSDLRVEVDTASVFTNHEKRDEHLRGRDFFDTDRYPKMIFTAANARRTGDRTYAIEGELELLGKSRPVVLTGTWNKSGKYPFGAGRPYVMGVSARGSLERSAFGMTYGVSKGWVGDEVELIIEFEARRQ
jgi:polyisoprenoid-binding protein YceI